MILIAGQFDYVAAEVKFQAHILKLTINGFLYGVIYTPFKKFAILCLILRPETRGWRMSFI